MVIDFDLVFKKSLLSQDESAFSTFYTETVDIFYRYLKSNYHFTISDNDDIIANFYVKCWNAFPTLDLNKNFSWFVWRVFKNTIIDFMKKRTDLAFSEMNVDGNDAPIFEDTLMADEQVGKILDLQFENDKIQSAVQKLDDKFQEVLYLKFVEDKSYQEIAEMLDLSQDTVRQRCSRWLKQLKSLLS